MNKIITLKKHEINSISGCSFLLNSGLIIAGAYGLSYLVGSIINKYKYPNYYNCVALCMLNNLSDEISDIDSNQQTDDSDLDQIDDIDDIDFF